MKKYIYHIAFKTFCVILAALSVVGAVASAFAVAVMIDKGGYREKASFEDVYREDLRNDYDWLCNAIGVSYYEHECGGPEDFYDWLLDIREQYGFDCTIQDESGKFLYSDRIESDDYALTLRERVNAGGDWRETAAIGDADPGSTYMVYDPVEYEVTVYVEEPDLDGDTETWLWLLNLAFCYRYFAVAAFGIFFVIFMVSIVFLCCAAGRRGDSKEVTVGFFDRIWLEVYVLAAVLLLLFEWAFAEALAVLWFALLCVGIFLTIDAFLVVLFILTLATRIKADCFWSSTAIGQASRWAKRILENMRLVPKVTVSLFAVALFDFFLATVLDFTEFLAAVLIEGLVLIGVLIWYAASIEKMYRNQVELAKGDMERRCDPSGLPPGLRSFGEAWNRSADGMQAAVEEKMKSERFKTELITNVSHDIKTPLTSIVNYVDLLKKEETDNEKIREYLEVLERQSARLKKLAEDLVESSKAASGMLSVDLAPLDAAVLLEQALGEYGPNFEEKGLTLCTSFSENAGFIMADGKRLWRVLDNLLNNICKYALSGTRVYASLEREGDRVHIIFRNISASPLSLSGEELTERFVRGDVSRNTEGSGLGLAIAQSLVELQKGKMEIFTDGDLFRVKLSFDRIR